MKTSLIISSTLIAFSLFNFSCLNQATYAQEIGSSQKRSVGAVIGNSLQDKASKPEQVIKVFRLQSADPQLAMQVISTLIAGNECRIAVDPRTNGIIVAGSKETLAVVEAVILKLDEGTRKKSSIIALKNVPAKDAAKLLLQQMGSADDLQMQIVPDQRQNSILISASEAAMTKALNLLESIDVPAPKGQLAGKNVLVSCYWIVDQASVGERFPDWKLREVPESVQKLVKDKLAKRTSIKNPMMAANLAVQVKIGEARESTNVIQNSGSSSINEKSSFEIELSGSIWNSPTSGSKVDMELQLQIGLRDQNKKSGDSRVQTKISSPLDHPVCLGMTPVNGVDSILVLEVVEAD